MSDTPKKILVVDDNPENLTLINGILSCLYKVYPIDSGAEALAFLQVRRPDLILLDVEMPDMNGIELFRILKENPALHSIPVIFLTGNTAIESESEAFQLGVSDYIRKPVDKVILLARVKLHLELEAYRAGKPEGLASV